MARIAGIDLPKDKRIEIGLTYIYGIGRKSAQDILAQTGINPDTRVKDLTEAEKAEIALLVQKAQANADHTLTNGERNKIREAGRQKIAADRAQAAKAASALAREKAKERASAQVLPDTFNWSDSVSNKYRGRR